MKTGNVVGIDFGTTNTSIVSLMRDELGEKCVVLGEDGEFPFASLLAISEDNRVFFGNKVRKNHDSFSENYRLVSSFKSLLGTGEAVEINGKPCPPKQIAAEYFKCLKRVVAKKYNIDITEAAFSFPVDFSAEARRDLIEAAIRADIRVNGFVSESTAAYLSESGKLKGKERVMVVDWGGGTLDISILEAKGGKVRELSVYGEKIGGDDIDRELARRVHAMMCERTEDKSKVTDFDEMPSEQRDKLIFACERAKIQLSEDGEDYPLTIRDYGELGTKTVTINNALFEDMIKPIIKDRVLSSINSAMERAGLSVAGIDAVIVAGGSANLRPFANAMLNLFGEENLILPEKSQFVSAKGAAMMPLVGGKSKLGESLGVMMSDDTVFELLKKDEDGVGSKSGTHAFSVVDNSAEAHVIIVGGGSKTVLKKINVPTKGFLNDRIEISARIDETQTAKITLHSTAVPDDLKDTVARVGGLTFYYDLSGAENAEASEKSETEVRNV